MAGKTITTNYESNTVLAGCGSCTDAGHYFKVPTKLSELENDMNFPSDSAYVHTDNNFTDTYKRILDRILVEWDPYLTELNETIAEAKAATAAAIEVTEKAQIFIAKPPIIVEEYWWIYDVELGEYINTEEKAIGDHLTPVKSYESIAEMEADYDSDDVKVGQFVIIDSGVDDPDNGKLYLKTDEHWMFITNLSGAQGIQGMSAYEIAVEYGFEGTEEEWLASLSAASEEAANNANAAIADMEERFEALEEEFRLAFAAYQATTTTNIQNQFNTKFTEFEDRWATAEQNHEQLLNDFIADAQRDVDAAIAQVESTEATIVQNEETRRAAEELRVQAENARMLAETSRVNAEQRRANDWFDILTEWGEYKVKFDNAINQANNAIQEATAITNEMRIQLANAAAATAAANEAATAANTAATNASSTVATLRQMVLTLIDTTNDAVNTAIESMKNATDTAIASIGAAIDNANTAAENANQAAGNANTIAEYTRIQGLYAESVAHHPPILGTDNYWYVWYVRGIDPDTGQVVGEYVNTGQSGAGIDIQGSYTTYEELIADHPIGDPNNKIGDAYIVGGNLYIYGQTDPNDPNTGQFTNVGQISGDPGKSPVIDPNGTGSLNWWTWDLVTGTWVDTGVQAILTKEQVESVLTGDITTHTHSDLLPVDLADISGVVTAALTDALPGNDVTRNKVITFVYNGVRYFSTSHQVVGTNIYITALGNSNLNSSIQKIVLTGTYDSVNDEYNITAGTVYNLVIDSELFSIDYQLLLDPMGWTYNLASNALTAYQAGKLLIASGGPVIGRIEISSQGNDIIIDTAYIYYSSLLDSEIQFIQHKVVVHQDNTVEYSIGPRTLNIIDNTSDQLIGGEKTFNEIPKYTDGTNTYNILTEKDLTEIYTSPHKLYIDGSFTGTVSTGTQFAPFKTITEAIQSHTDGVVYVMEIAPGTYVEDITITNSQQIFLQGIGITGQYEVVIDGNLTITGSQRIRLQNLSFYGSCNINNSRLIYGDNVSVRSTVTIGGNQYTSGQNNYIYFENSFFDSSISVTNGQLVNLNTCTFSLTSSANLALLSGTLPQQVIADSCTGVILQHVFGAFESVNTAFAKLSTNVSITSTATATATNALVLNSGTLWQTDATCGIINKTGDCIYSLGMLQYEPTNANVLTGTKVDGWSLHSNQIFDHNTRSGYTKVNDTIEGHLDGINSALVELESAGGSFVIMADEDADDVFTLDETSSSARIAAALGNVTVQDIRAAIESKASIFYAYNVIGDPTGIYRIAPVNVEAYVPSIVLTRFYDRGAQSITFTSTDGTYAIINKNEETYVRGLNVNSGDTGNAINDIGITNGIITARKQFTFATEQQLNDVQDLTRILIQGDGLLLIDNDSSSASINNALGGQFTEIINAVNNNRPIYWAGNNYLFPLTVSSDNSSQLTIFIEPALYYKANFAQGFKVINITVSGGVYTADVFEDRAANGFLPRNGDELNNFFQLYGTGIKRILTGIEGTSYGSIVTQDGAVQLQGSNSNTAEAVTLTVSFQNANVDGDPILTNTKVVAGNGITVTNNGNAGITIESTGDSSNSMPLEGALLEEDANFSVVSQEDGYIELNANKASTAQAADISIHPNAITITSTDNGVVNALEIDKDGIKANGSIVFTNSTFKAGDNIVITDNGDGTFTIEHEEFDSVIVVSELPTTGEVNRLYLLINADSGTSNVYTKYIWADEDNDGTFEWVNLGDSTTSVDLTDYYTKTEIDALLAEKIGTDNVVMLTGAQTIAGVKTFSNQAIFPAGLSTSSITSSGAFATLDSSGFVSVAGNPGYIQLRGSSGSNYIRILRSANDQLQIMSSTPTNTEVYIGSVIDDNKVVTMKDIPTATDYLALTSDGPTEVVHQDSITFLSEDGNINLASGDMDQSYVRVLPDKVTIGGDGSNTIELEASTATLNGANILTEGGAQKVIFGNPTTLANLTAISLENYDLRYTISANQTLSFAASNLDGAECIISVRNTTTNDYTITLPTANVQSDDTTITCPASYITEISIRYIFNTYVVKVI